MMIKRNDGNIFCCRQYYLNHCYFDEKNDEIFIVIEYEMVRLYSLYGMIQDALIFLVMIPGLYNCIYVSRAISTSAKNTNTLS